MVNSIFAGLSSSFNNLLAYFLTVVRACNMYHVILGTLFAVFVVRFVIYPFLKGGVGASDPVKRVKGGVDNG